MRNWIAAGYAVGMVALLVLPFVPGYAMSRRRRHEIDAAVLEQKLHEEDTNVLPLAGRARKALSDGRTRTLELPATPTPAIVIVEPERPNLAIEANPGWHGDVTGEWGIIDHYDAHEAEVVTPVARPALDAAIQAFYRDPLGSWCPPPTEALDLMSFLPEANGTFDLMAEQGRLTGVGADIDAEWEAWNLYEMETVPV